MRSTLRHQKRKEKIWTERKERQGKARRETEKDIIKSPGCESWGKNGGEGDCSLLMKEDRFLFFPFFFPLSFCMIASYLLY